MISEMSENDIQTLGHSVGFSPVLDNPRAARYNPVQAGANGFSGNCLYNNHPFASTADVQTADAGIQVLIIWRIQHFNTNYQDM